MAKTSLISRLRQSLTSPQMRAKEHLRAIEERFITFDSLLKFAEDETPILEHSKLARARLVAILPSAGQPRLSRELIPILQKNTLQRPVEISERIADELFVKDDDPILSLAVIEEPVARFLRLFQDDWARHALAKDDPDRAGMFLETLRECIDSRAPSNLFNHQSRCLAVEGIHDNGNLESAKALLRDSVSIVGTVEHLEDLLVSLQVLLGWNDIYPPRSHSALATTKSSPADHITNALSIRELPPDLLDAITAANAHDVELYQFVLELVSKRNDQFGIDDEARKEYEHRRQQQTLTHQPIPLHQSSQPLAHRSHDTSILETARQLVAHWQTKSISDQVNANDTQLDRFVIPYSEIVQSPTPIGDNELRRLVYLHIPKAGGTTLEYIIAKNHRANDVLHINNPVLQRNPAAAYKRLDLMPVIMGHFATNHVVYQMADAPFVHLTMLRDPVQRVLSFYRYWSTDPERAHHERVSQLSLEAFLDQKDLIELKNGQTLRLAGLLQRKSIEEGIDESAALAHAKRTLESHMTLFGVVDQYAHFLLMCHSLLGWQDIFYQRRNVSNVSDRSLPSPAILDRIRENNQLDLELYLFAAALFKERFESLGFSDDAITMFSDRNSEYSDRIESLSTSIHSHSANLGRSQHDHQRNSH